MLMADASFTIDNSIQKSFIDMKKQMFTLPKQVTKQYSEIQLQMGKA